VRGGGFVHRKRTDQGSNTAPVRAGEKEASTRERHKAGLPSVRKGLVVYRPHRVSEEKREMEKSDGELLHRKRHSVDEEAGGGVCVQKPRKTYEGGGTA